MSDAKAALERARNAGLLLFTKGREYEDVEFGSQEFIVAQANAEAAEATFIAALDAAVRAAFEEAARVGDLEAERIKHTSHREGLGMGDQVSEAACLRVAAAIRARAEEVGK